MGQRLALGVLGKAQQRGGSGLGRRQVLGVEALQRGHFEQRAELAQAQRGVELPVGSMRARGAVLLQRSGQGADRISLAQQQFGRVQPGQPAGQFFFAAFGQAQLAAGQPQPGQSPGRAQLDGSAQQGVDPVVEQRAVGDRAGRDHPHHLALDRTLGGGHVADLLGDRHRLAKLDQLGQVVLDRMHRHTGHHHRLAGALPARRQRDVEQSMGLAGVVEKELVEVAHAVQHERVGEVGLDAQILGHHRRVPGEVGVLCDGW